MPLLLRTLPYVPLLFLITLDRAIGQEADAKASPKPAAKAKDDEPVADAIPVIGDNFVDQMKGDVSRELKTLQEMTGLKDERVQELLRTLEPTIKKEVERRGPSTDLVVMSVPQFVSEPVLKVLAAEAAKVVDDKSRFATYKQDLDLRRQLVREATISGFVQTLDTFVGLTAEQRKQVVEVAEQLFATADLPSPIYNFRPLGSKFPAKKLSAILTAEQLTYLKRVNSVQPTAFLTRLMTSGSKPGDRKADLTDQLRDTAKIKIDYVDREFDLTTSQKKRLELVAKSVVSTAVTDRMAAENLYKDYVMSAQNGRAEIKAPDMEQIATAMLHPVLLFDRQERWQKFLRSTLSEQQQEKLAKLQEQKKRQSKQTLGRMLVMSFGRNLKLSGKQQYAMLDLLTPNLDPPPRFAGGMMAIPEIDTYRAMLKISEADYISAMGNENWAKFKPQLDQLKQQLEVMEARKKD